MNPQGPSAARTTRRFLAPPERAYDAWLDPALLGRWMFGPDVRDEEVVRLALDARIGGAFSFLVRRQGQEVDHVGTYLELDRPRRLTFTWAAAPAPSEPSRVVVDLCPQDGGCDLALAHELHHDWADAAGRIAASWGRMLDALAAALGERPP